MRRFGRYVVVDCECFRGALVIKPVKGGRESPAEGVTTDLVFRPSLAKLAVIALAPSVVPAVFLFRSGKPMTLLVFVLISLVILAIGRSSLSVRLSPSHIVGPGPHFGQRQRRIVREEVLIIPAIDAADTKYSLEDRTTSVQISVAHLSTRSREQLLSVLEAISKMPQQDDGASERKES